MIEAQGAGMLRGMELRLATSAALLAFDEELTIVAWNQAAEELTGIAAADAIGRPCWAVLAAYDDAGGLVCHKQCSRARLARQGWPLRTEEWTIRSGDGRRRVAVDTVSLLGNGCPLFLHLFHDASEAAAADGDEPAREPGPIPRLTPRQLDVLRLLGEGESARAIAAKLGLTVPTVRNHIRGVLLEFGAHSQLEAVSLARRHGLL